MGADEPRQVRKEATAVRFPVCRGQPGPPLTVQWFLEKHEDTKKGAVAP